MLVVSRSGWEGRWTRGRCTFSPVPNLTLYSQTHDGKCLASVLAELQNGHRSNTEPKVSEKDLDMPNWAPIFTSLSGDRSMGYLRLTNVARHIEKLQVK